MLKNLPNMIVVSFDEACEILSDPITSGPISHVVSIMGPGDQRPPMVGKTVLQLTFDDVSVQDAPLLQTAQDAHPIAYPSAQHVQQILKFAQAAQQAKGTILVHCYAGQSRSPAAAILMHALWMGPGQESQAVDLVRSIVRSRNPGRRVSPNELLMEHGDSILRRGQALVKAADAIRNLNYPRGMW